MAKRTKSACLSGAVILLVAGVGPSQQAHGATVPYTITQPSATQCTATIPWQVANTRPDTSKNDTVQFETNIPHVTFTVSFTHGTPFGANHTIGGIAKGASKQFQIDSRVDPGTLCNNTANTCYYPFDISVNGKVCNVPSPQRPVNSDGIIVKPTP